MSLFQTLSSQIDAVAGDENKLLHTYMQLWESAMAFSGDQFKESAGRLHTVSQETDQSKCWALLSEGMLYIFHPTYGNAADKLLEAVEAFQQINDKAGEGAAYCLLTLSYKNLGQLDKAQECAQLAINYIGEDERYRQFLCIAYYQVGEMNYLLKDHTTAIVYFNKGLEYAKEGSILHARTLVGLANAYKDSDKLNEAFETFQFVLQKIEGKGINLLESKVYADLGNYYYRLRDFEQSVGYQQKSIRIREQHKMYNPLITNYMELAELYCEQNNPDEALSYALQAEKLAQELNITLKLSQIYQILSRIYERQGNIAVAFDYYKKYHHTKEEVFSQENTRQIKQLSMQHEMENTVKEKELFRLRNVVLKEALDEIESSVRYAQRIQEAMLPHLNLIQSKLPQTFVLYKPKDIVAGDFYWIDERGDTTFIAAADCTGHGVPGAMVSVVCSNALNRAVKEFGLTDPGKILDKVTDLVTETFAKSTEDVKDGMDISLLAINQKTKTIHWSGANNPLIYIEDKTLKKIKADKQPVGKSDKRTPFTTHTISYAAGTSFYLFTDGYADQFGGPLKKKFKYKQLEELFEQIVDRAPADQQSVLSQVFEDWKGNLEQVDDVCVVGVRL